MANHTSQHILGTASNLLGFCLFVITALHVTDRQEEWRIDEWTSLIAVLLTISCLLSFASIRTKNERLEANLETIADYIFVVALLGILGVILVIARSFL
tara:strand:+ start:340 stop:636 length:297 start_codon:yes stop_codon:yes gene_type:complete